MPSELAIALIAAMANARISVAVPVAAAFMLIQLYLKHIDGPHEVKGGITQVDVCTCADGLRQMHHRFTDCRPARTMLARAGRACRER